MFPPSLYKFVVQDEEKNMILVLNKIDLVPPAAVAAWKEFLTRTYPGLQVVYFTSCPGYNLTGARADKSGTITISLLLLDSLPKACKFYQYVPYCLPIS